MTSNNSTSTGPYTESRTKALIEQFKTKDPSYNTKHTMSNGSSLFFQIESTSSPTINIKAHVAESKIHLRELDPTGLNRLLLPTSNLHSLRSSCTGSLVAYCLKGRMITNNTRSLVEFSQFKWHLGIVVHHTWNFTSVMDCHYNEETHVIYPKGRSPIILMDRKDSTMEFKEFSMQFLERFPSFDSAGFLKVCFKIILIDFALFSTNFTNIECFLFPVSIGQCSRSILLYMS
jgi:hypothetical protein